MRIGEGMKFTSIVKQLLFSLAVLSATLAPERAFAEGTAQLQPTPAAFGFIVIRPLDGGDYYEYTADPTERV